MTVESGADVTPTAIPRYRWTLTVTCSRNSHYIFRQTVTASSQVDAERQAVNVVRERRLTDPHGIPWDRWTLMGRDVSGRPFRIVATGTHNMTVWSQVTMPTSGKFGGRR